MTELHMDLHQLARLERAFEDAADALDRVGHRTPAGGDLGAAGALVNTGLAVATEGAARLASEARVLGIAVGMCREDMSYTDAVAVGELFRVTS
jgi:hypothetical protein